MDDKKANTITEEQRLLVEAFKAGFNFSGEGFNNDFAPSDADDMVNDKAVETARYLTRGKA